MSKSRIESEKRRKLIQSTFLSAINPSSDTERPNMIFPMVFSNLRGCYSPQHLTSKSSLLPPDAKKLLRSCSFPTSVPAPGKDQPNRPARAATSGRGRCMLCGDRPRATLAVMKRKVGGCKSHHSNVGIYTSILVSPQPEKLFHETIEVS